MRRKFIDNILLIFIIFSMLALASFSLFLMTKDSAYAVDINNQNNQTNNGNVTFDAGFEVSSGSSLAHSIVSDINPEYKYLRLKMGLAGGCTLINPQVQFYDSANTSNINFDLGFGNITSSYIKSSNNTNKTITFNNLTTGLDFGCQMSVNFGNTVKISKLNETSKVVFTATCRDASGNTAPVYKEIYFNVGWTANLTMDVFQKVREFYHVTSTDEMVVKTEITTKINFAGKHNILPVKQTQLIVDVPTYKNIAPTSVTVSAVKTIATNGKDENTVSFNTNNYSYNSGTRKLTITVQNPNTSGSVPSVRGSDEYVVTYVYPKAAYDMLDTNGVNIVNKINATMTLYSNTSTANLTKSINSTMTLNDFTDDNSSGSLHKGDLYFNTLKNSYSKDKDYTYIVTREIKELGNVTSTEKLEFDQVHFVTNTSTLNSYINGRNYVPITKLEFPVNSFNEYLGTSGSIQVYAGNTLLGTINSSSTTSIIEGTGEVCYAFDIPTSYQQSSEKFYFTNTAPIAEHAILTTYVHRAISKDLPYTVQQIQQSRKTTEQIHMYTAKRSSPNVYELDKTLTWENIANDTYSNASLNVLTPSLKAQAEEQYLDLNIVLDNKQTDTDIWQAPSFDIVLPEYIEAIDGTINVGVNLSQVDPNLTVQMGSTFSARAINGQLHIALPFIGTQQARFNPQTIISVRMKVTVDKYAPNIEKDIKLYYINSLAYKYINKATWQLTPATTGENNITFPIYANNTPCGIASDKINFVTTPTLLCVSELTNYNGSNSLNSMDNKDTAAPIDRTAIRPKMNLIVQNNHTVPVSGVTVIGRIPYTNNKSAITNIDLGTNINTTLASRLTQVGSSIPNNNITIYYSDNLNATADLSNSSNNWVTSPSNLSTIKSYMIVINSTLAVGQQVKFTYDFALPANLNYNKILFANFGATYNVNGNINSAESGKIGLTTGQGPVLSATKTASLTSGSTVKEGDIITYSITVNNTGSVAANNVIITDNIPANTVYVRKNGSTYTPEQTTRTITQNIGTLAPGANYTYTFYVVVGEITTNTNIQNTATITADGVDPITSSTSTVSAVTSSPNLSIVKSSNIPNGSTVKGGVQITYKIVVRNDGDGIARNVVIHDVIPRHTVYIDPSTGNPDPSKVKIDSPSKDILRPGETYELAFTVIVNKLEQNTTIENVATVTCDNGPEKTSNKEQIPGTTSDPILRVEKKSSIPAGTSVKEGDKITYTITVYNDGYGPAKNVVIRDTVPENTIYYDTVTNAPNPSMLAVSSSPKASLEPGENYSFEFTVVVGRISSNTTITNTAKATSDTLPDVSSNPNGIDAKITIPNLRVEKTSSIASDAIVREGDKITYTITVYNDGTSPAYDISITDTVPEHTILYENNQKIPNKKNLEKKISVLAPGQSDSFTFTVVVDEIVENTVIQNTGKAKGENGPETPSNPVKINAEPTVPKLRVEKTSSISEDTTLKPGDTITYTITVYNDGKTRAFNVSIIDTVPEHTILYENGEKLPDQKNLKKDIPVLEAGQSESLTFTVIVDEILENTVIQNTGKVNADHSPDVPSNPVNVNVEPSVPVLRVEKTSSIAEGTTLKSGDIITYTITVYNDGKSIAYNVVISDDIPQNTTYVEKIGSEYLKDKAKSSVSKTIEKLLPGQSETLTFSVMVNTLSKNTTITNTAKVNAHNSPEIPSNSVGISAEPKDNPNRGQLPYTGHYSLLIILATITLSVGGFTVFQYRKVKKSRIMRF